MCVCMLVCTGDKLHIYILSVFQLYSYNIQDIYRERKKNGDFYCLNLEKKRKKEHY